MLSMHTAQPAHTHTHTHTEAIPEWRTQCTRGVIYYTELTIPRTITASLSNRLKMAPRSVYAQTQDEHGAYVHEGFKRRSKLCVTDNLGGGEQGPLSPNSVFILRLHMHRETSC